jgi:hypothetical protein
MSIKIDVDAEAVNKMVTDAILDSAIGETLRAVVSKKVEALSKEYNNPVELEVDRQIQLIVKDLVQEKFKPMIAAKVNELMTEELVGRISTRAWENLLEQFRRYDR